MKRLITSLLLILFTFVGFLYYCKYVYVSTPIQALTNSSESVKVIDIIESNNDVIMFYRDVGTAENDLSVAFIKKRLLTGWDYIWSGKAIGQEKVAITYSWKAVNINKESFFKNNDQELVGLIWGVISDPQIEIIYAQVPGYSAPASLKKSGSTRCWYVLWYRDYNIAPKLYCYSSNGELIYIANDYDKIPD